MRTSSVAAGVALALALTGSALTGCGGGTSDKPSSAPLTPTPSATPTPAPPAEPLPVWYDADGLHHGDAVEKTAVPLLSVPGTTQPHLALVRTGALYRSAKTGEVWFHPWGGEPRVVGRSTAAGPGGDAEGDVAVWFNGWHLVVYDTARGEVLSRTREVAGVEQSSDSAEHVGHGNGWVHVSSAQVVWQSPDGLGRRDLVKGTSELAWRPRPATPSAPHTFHGPPGTQPVVVGARFVDVSETSAAWTQQRGDEGEQNEFIVDVAGTAGSRILTGLEWPGRLSPDGSWLLTAEIADGTHGAAFTDLRTGEVWKPFAKATYAWFSWAYGDVAVILTSTNVRAQRTWTLQSCSASRRTCEPMQTRGDVVLPNP